MLKGKSIPHQIIFDIETVPDLDTARRVYPALEELAIGLREISEREAQSKKKRPESKSDELILLDKLYEIAGATPDDPRPFLKYFLHRVVSISGISRRQIIPTEENPIGIELRFFSLPTLESFDAPDDDFPEKRIIEKFMTGIGAKKPQLIGWSSTLFDMPCLLQRAMINGIAMPKLSRPDKPWEGEDYFSRGSDYNIDLMQLIASSSGQSKCTLNEFARALRIPGKVGVSGADVADLWFAGRHKDIVAYNECDTATTYLIWLEMLHASGHITFEDHVFEKAMFRLILTDRIEAGADHLKGFVAEWDNLQGIDPEPEINPAPAHDLYKDGDEGIPSSILDSNGQVILGLCKRCNRAEADLEGPCEASAPAPDQERIGSESGNDAPAFDI